VNLFVDVCGRDDGGGGGVGVGLLIDGSVAANKIINKRVKVGLGNE
jgi:hypothetical protein